MKDGGPAFPGIEDTHAAADSYGRGYTGIDAYGGMTFRDYFAAKAMAGYISLKPLNPDELKPFAEAMYLIADAMLEEREKGQK